VQFFLFPLKKNKLVVLAHTETVKWLYVALQDATLR
jgi:hypothetical protein